MLCSVLLMASKDGGNDGAWHGAANNVFSPRLFFKTTELISSVFKSVYAVTYVEILSICLKNHKRTPWKNLV